MALSKGLRLLWKQEPGPSALLEARGRQDCLLLEAGTVAALTLSPGAKLGEAGEATCLPWCPWCLGAEHLYCASLVQALLQRKLQIQGQDLVSLEETSV